MFPDFDAYWNSDENLFMDDDGSFSYHGVFAEFSHYFRDHFSEMGKEKIQEFCDYIETFVRDDTSHDDIDNAICTGFLENVYGGALETELPKYLGAKSRKFYVLWHGL